MVRLQRSITLLPAERAALDQLVLHATSLRIPVVEVEGGTLTAIDATTGTAITRQAAQQLAVVGGDEIGSDLRRHLEEGGGERWHVTPQAAR